MRKIIIFVFSLTILWSTICVAKWYAKTEGAKGIFDASAVIDKDASERLQTQMTALFPRDVAGPRLKNTTVLVIGEDTASGARQQHVPWGLVQCTDRESRKFSLTASPTMPSFEVGFDAEGGAVARVPQKGADVMYNETFSLMQKAFKELDVACGVGAVMLDKFEDARYPLQSGLTDVIFESSSTEIPDIQASFDLSGKITSFAVRYTLLQTKTPQEIAQLIHDTISENRVTRPF